MRGLTDLHLHSNRSDGTESPTRLVEMAAASGVTTMALVDHDVLDGIGEARRAADSHGIRFVPGVELSVDHDGTKMHMLVYFIEDEPGPLEARLAWLREGRDERNIEIVKNLNDAGYGITMDDVLRWAAGESVGRPHIADALVELGAVENRDAAFADLLGDDGLVYVERRRLSAVDAIALARAGGGVPVVAHPKTISGGAADYARLFRELVDAGLGGIEAHHSSHPVELRDHLTDLAHRLGIAATGGSDFHGAKKRSFRIGVGTGDLRVPDTAYDELVAQRS